MAVGVHTRLHLHERAVHTAFFQDQFIVGALLYDEPSGDDSDLIGVANRREAVCDHNGRHALGAQHRVDRILHRALRRRIERGRGLVEYEDGRVADHRAGDGDALLVRLRAKIR